MQQLGDRHNFGQSVHLDEVNGVLHKPRSVFWEFLFLGSSSPLKYFFADRARSGGCANPLDTFPSLRFENTSASANRGTVEQFLPLDNQKGLTLNTSLAESLGGAIATCAWFGLGDLHLSNVRLTIVEGRLIFAPLDIEVVLGKFQLPSQTHLLGVSSEKTSTPGLTGLFNSPGAFPGIDEVAALCHGYLEVLRYLTQCDRGIRQLLADIPEIAEAPLRVILRDTKDYAAFLQGTKTPGDFSPAFAPEELAQLERGDVPFFFRTFGDPAVKYFSAPDCRSPAVLPPELLKERATAWTDGADSADRADGAPGKKGVDQSPAEIRQRELHSLTTAGSLQLVRAIANPGRLCGRASYKDTMVALEPDRLTIETISANKSWRHEKRL